MIFLFPSEPVWYADKVFLTQLLFFLARKTKSQNQSTLRNFLFFLNLNFSLSHSVFSSFSLSNFSSEFMQFFKSQRSLYLFIIPFSLFFLLLFNSLKFNSSFSVCFHLSFHFCKPVLDL